MDVSQFMEGRRLLEEEEARRYRNLCVTCFQPEFGCYCADVKPFDSRIKFAILIHPIEARRRIATGRMSHLSLIGSELIKGQDYTDDPKVNQLLEEASGQAFLLYPGVKSFNLSQASQTQKTELLGGPRPPLIFVIDGTWATAKKMIWQSQNLKRLPQLSFNADKISRFRVRKQPAAECLSTIEAIHRTIEEVGSACGFDTSTREHDNLVRVFDKVVERQLSFVQAKRDNGTYRTRHRSA